MRRLSFFSFLLSSFLFLLSCSQPPPPSSTPFPTSRPSLYVYRFTPPSLVEFSEDLQAIGEIPFSVPPSCGLFNIFPAPAGRFTAIELSCPNGPTVLVLNTETHSVIQPVATSDSHFLAWTPAGDAVYLKADSLGDTQILRVYTDGEPDTMPVSPFTYDLAAAPDGNEFTFTFSGGLGQGSELWLAENHGKNTRKLYVDPLNYVSFARYSPDGMWIAFIKTPDVQTPFTVGELWVVDRDGSRARKLSDADAGHGYAANWSPDGKRIAFVRRENPGDERADYAEEALISNIYIVDVQSGAVKQVTRFEHGRAETPSWSPDGNTLAFTAVVNDRMDVQIADTVTGQIQPLMAEPACCPAWMRK